MGTIFKRGKKYYLNLIVNGKRLRKPVGTSKRMAELALKDYELKVLRRELDLEVEDSTIEKLFEEFNAYSRTNHAPASTRRYNNVIANFRIFLATQFPNIKRVSQLNPTIFEKYKTFRKTVDPQTLKVPAESGIVIKPNALKARSRTLNYEIKTMRSILNFGVKHKLCRENPAKGVPLLKVNDSARPRFLTSEEIDLFLAHADSDMYPVFYTFLNTGLRLGELLNLQWSDIDFDRAKLIIRKKDFWIPKAGEREIPLHQGMLILLRDVRPRRAKGDDFVFTRADGSKLSVKLRQALIRIAKQAGISNLTKVHTLRHTFASHLVMKGVDLPTVQKLLGHTDIQTTMIYAHLAPDHLAGAVDKLMVNESAGSDKVIKMNRKTS